MITKAKAKEALPPPPLEDLTKSLPKHSTSDPPPSGLPPKPRRPVVAIAKIVSAKKSRPPPLPTQTAAAATAAAAAASVQFKVPAPPPPPPTAIPPSFKLELRPPPLPPPPLPDSVALPTEPVKFASGKDVVANSVNSTVASPPPPPAIKKLLVHQRTNAHKLAEKHR